MIRSLWFKLSAAFTFITMFSITVLALIPSIILNYLEFVEIVTPETIARVVGEEQILFAEAVRDPRSGKWLAMAEREMESKILNMTTDDGEFYMGFACLPEMYYRVVDKGGAVFFSYPETFPPHAAAVFAQEAPPRGTGGDAARLLDAEGHIWIVQTLVDNDGGVRGRLELLLIADYDFWELVDRFLYAYIARWYAILGFFSLVGLMCGVVANWFVTGRLKGMNTIAAIWSGGNFGPRIPVDNGSRDVLAEHSRTLNGMADELESLVELRQRAAVTEERDRMARELHDTVKQNLFALKLQLAAIKRKNTTEATVAHIDEAQQITHEAQQDIMGILAQLDPVAPGDKGFHSRLIALAADLRRRYNIEVVWERREDVAASPEEEQTLIRIAQEAMSNSARHGRATRIVVDAFREGGVNHWVLADNGTGLPEGHADTRTSGLGLIFMRERVKELPGGTLSLGNAPRGGTKVEVKWRAQR